MPLTSSSLDTSDYADTLASILATKNLSLYRVCRQTEEIYGRLSPYFIPHNYYSEFRRTAFSPSIYQLAALSRISGYRLFHWLRCFGIDVETIATFQIRLPSRRTQLLNVLWDPERGFPVFAERSRASEWPNVAPLSRLVEMRGSQAIGENSNLRSRGFVYAKIGYEDAMAFPLLAPESVVRADPDFEWRIRSQAIGTVSECVFLLEHSRGYICSQLRRIAEDTFSVVGLRIPYAEVELVIPAQARILGVVDLEVRSLVRTLHPDLPADLGQTWRPGTLKAPRSVAEMLKDGRRQMKLSLPLASELSHEIAKHRGDERYSISASSLSDYEASEHGPRHIHKIISLCAIYSLKFTDFLSLLGIAVESLGSEAMPGEVMGEIRDHDDSPSPIEKASDSPLEKLEMQLSDLPVLLHGSLDYISGLPKLSLEDFFWTGGEKKPLHPVLRGAMLVMVNRRKKKPAALLSIREGDASLFVLLKRDGTYVCAPTTLQDRYLTIHGYPHAVHRPLQLRNRDQAEVVGQIVALVRRIYAGAVNRGNSQRQMVTGPLDETDARGLR
jgi:hypothetical protein